MKHPHKRITLDIRIFTGHEVIHPFHAYIVRTDRHRLVCTAPTACWSWPRITDHTGPAIRSLAQYCAIQSQHGGIRAQWCWRGRGVGPDLPLGAVVRAIGLFSLRGKAQGRHHCPDNETFHTAAPLIACSTFVPQRLATLRPTSGSVDPNPRAKHPLRQTVLALKAHADLAKVLL